VVVYQCTHIGDFIFIFKPRLIISKQTPGLTTLFDCDFVFLKWFCSRVTSSIFHM